MGKKKFKDREEKLKDFWDVMQKIDWQPVPAAFQLSPNKQWGKHHDWDFLREDKKKIVQEKIWQYWGLQLIIDDGMKAYFGQPWERTRIVDFVGDIEEPNAEREAPKPQEQIN